MHIATVPSARSTLQSLGCIADPDESTRLQLSTQSSLVDCLSSRRTGSMSSETSIVEIEFPELAMKAFSLTAIMRLMVLSNESREASCSTVFTLSQSCHIHLAAKLSTYNGHSQ